MKMSLLKSMLCAVAVGTAASAMAADPQPFTLPMNLKPTLSEFERFTTLNANNDVREWAYDEDGSCLKYSYSSTKDADDWVFIPVTLTAADTYLKVSVDALASGAASWVDEKFQLAIGADAAAASMSVVLNQTVDKGEYTAYSTTFANTLTGTAWLGIHAVSPKNSRTLQIRNIVLESYATPISVAPTVVSATCEGLDLTAIVKAPQKSVQGADIAGNMTIRMSVDGTMAEEKTGIAPGAEVTFTKELAKGTHELTFTALLTTDGTTTESAAATASVEAKNLNAQYTLPFTFGPTSKTEFDECTPFDANGDDVTWQYRTESFYYYYHSNNAANDWIILPAVNFGNATKVKVSVEAHCEGASYPEAFQICIGQEPTVAAMTEIVIEEESLTSTSWKTYETEIETAGGIRYIGLHATSENDKYGLYLRNIKVEDPNPNPQVGVEAITGDDNAPVEYFTMQGIRLSEPVKGQMLIKRQGTKAVKVIIR